MVDEWRRMAGGKRKGMGGRREEGRKPRYNGTSTYNKDLRGRLHGDTD